MGDLVSFTDLAAVIGALAWIPPIFVGVRSWVTRPSIRVITQPAPEVGYTALGPIINLRIALTVTHKDIVVTSISLRVTHESGTESLFAWRGIVQRMGTINYPQIGAIPFEKESSVLALKVSLKDIEERFIRFQNLEYLRSKEVLDTVSVKKLAFLRQAQLLDVPLFLKGQEMTDVYAFIRQSFSWKPGGYRVQVLLESPDVFTVLDDEYTFTLSPLQVKNLSDNLCHIEPYYLNEIVPPPPENPERQISWNWVYPEMQKANEYRTEV